MHSRTKLDSIISYFMESPQSLEADCRLLELRETHISAVLLSRTRAYKFKKAVDYGFVSQSNLDERVKNCEAELVLNQRTSDDVYEGVNFVHEGEHGFVISEQEEGCIEPCVVMRRLDDDDSMQARVRSGRISTEEIDLVAAFIAEFHDRCDRTAEARALRDFAGNQAENQEAIRDFVKSDKEQAISAGILRPGEAASLLALLGRLEIFTSESLGRVLERERRGLILDGHGDLRLDHIFVERDRVLIIDCVEFNPAFRAVDPFEDLAFASMGLRMEGREDLGERLAQTYTGRTTDVRGWNLLALFEIYRACVRAKVDAIQCRGAESFVGGRLHRRFYGYLRLAGTILERELQRPRPRLLAVGGLPGSGKSTFAQRLAAKYRAPVIATDVVRKRLRGSRPEHDRAAAAFHGIYSRRTSRRTYARLRALAAVLLRSGRSVVLDGTFGARRERSLLKELAERTRAALRFYEVNAAEDQIKARLEERARLGSVSDVRDFQLWKEVAKGYQRPGEELGTALWRVESGPQGSKARRLR